VNEGQLVGRPKNTGTPRYCGVPVGEPAGCCRQQLAGKETVPDSPFGSDTVQS
jgi:hypothetical protein